MLHGEEFEIDRYQRREGMTGYWLRIKKDEVFIPIEQEDLLRPVLR